MYGTRLSMDPLSGVGVDLAGASVEESPGGFV